MAQEHACASPRPCPAALLAERSSAAALFGSIAECTEQLQRRPACRLPAGGRAARVTARAAASAGEAQKIDRIMEKFAERYCCDNQGAFRSADGAYLLAFALIMLNTDAHNPHADRNLGPDDFVNMCQAPARSRRYPNLPYGCLPYPTLSCSRRAQPGDQPPVPRARLARRRKSVSAAAAAAAHACPERRRPRRRAAATAAAACRTGGCLAGRAATIGSLAARRRGAELRRTKQGRAGA